MTLAPCALASWIAVTPMPLGAAALDEERLAPACRCARSKTFRPDSEEGLRQAGRLDVGEVCGRRQALADRGDAVLRIAAAAHQRTDPVADREAGRTHRIGVARSRWWPASSRPGRSDAPGGTGYLPRRCRDVGPVHARSRDADQHLAGGRDGHRALRQPEHLGPAGRRDLDRSQDARRAVSRGAPVRAARGRARPSSTV